MRSALSKLALPVLALACACGAPDTGHLFEVTVVLLRPAPQGCVVSTLTPLDQPSKAQSQTVTIARTSRTFSLRYGFLSTGALGENFEFSASLHVPNCDSPAVDSFTTPRFRGSVKSAFEPFSLVERATDGGVPEPDAGPADAGAQGDAGTPAPDAGRDAGGPADAGAPPDAGADAGADAGPLSCDGGFALLPPLGQAALLNDAAPLGDGTAWVGGAAGLSRADSSWSSAAQTCIADVRALWVRPTDGTVFFAGDGKLASLSAAPGAACAILSSTATGTATALWGSTEAGVTDLYLTFAQPVIRRRSTDSTRDLDWDLNADTEAAALFDLDGVSPTTLRAVGRRNGNGGRAVVLRFTPPNSWTKEIDFNEEVFNAVAVRGPNTVLVGGTKSKANAPDAQPSAVYRWNGANWLDLGRPPGLREVYALAAVEPANFYASGAPTAASGPVVILKHAGGSSWSTVASFPVANGWVARLRGSSLCDLWGAGQGGVVLRSAR